MNAIRRVVDVFVQRFVASVGSMLAARMETVAAMMHAEQQDELEQRARQLEADGKPHLADDLRSRASQLAEVTPGAGAQDVPVAISHQSRQPERPRIAQVDSPSDDASRGQRTARGAHDSAAKATSFVPPRQDELKESRGSGNETGCQYNDGMGTARVDLARPRDDDRATWTSVGRPMCSPCLNPFLDPTAGARGYIELERAAAAFYEVDRPLVFRSPNGPAPDFSAIARKLEKRWRNVNTRRVTLCWATPLAARLLGGLATFAARSSQLEHDLGTSSILVRLHETHPQLADCWIGEDILAPRFRGRQSFVESDS